MSENSFVIQAIKNAIEPHAAQLVGTESSLSNSSILRNINKARAEILIIIIEKYVSQDERIIQSIKNLYTNLTIIIVAKNHADILSLMMWQANGYLLISEGVHELVKAIKSVYSRQDYYSLEVAQILAKQINQKVVPLTPRETQVYFLLKWEISKKQISDLLGICDSTIRTYIGNIKSKLGPNCLDSHWRS